MKRFFLILALSAFLPAAGLAEPPAEPGLYASFHTNRGSFTCALFFEQVPMTVANFVGLAEGSRPWIDLETGQARSEPFYDGLTFHRVIPDFMIQGGSRNGNGTDGPGYQFPDEFIPGLVHAEEGTLSMANSGFDTNGSQFFVTVAPTDHLNYKHTVFGEVIEGMSVVEAISTVEVLPGTDRPAEPVIIQSVEIHRVGPAAIAFDAEAHGLPEIGAVRPTLNVTEGGDYALHFPRQENRHYTLSYSNDLQSWLRLTLPLTGEIPGMATFDLNAIATERDQQFYRLLEVDYSGVDYGFLPENLVGKTLQLNLSTNQTVTLHIDDERTPENEGQWLGTGTVDGDPETNLNYVYGKTNNRGRLIFILHGYPQINTDLKFSDEEYGTFTGQILFRNQQTGEIQPFDIHGTFTLVPQQP